MGLPQVTIGFNTKSWSSMTLMIWGHPHDLGNPYINIPLLRLRLPILGQHQLSPAFHHLQDFLYFLQATPKCVSDMKVRPQMVPNTGNLHGSEHNGFSICETFESDKWNPPNGGHITAGPWRDSGGWSPWKIQRGLLNHPISKIEKTNKYVWNHINAY